MGKKILNDLVLANSSVALQFGDADTYIYESSDDVLDTYSAGILSTRVDNGKLAIGLNGSIDDRLNIDYGHIRFNNVVAPLSAPSAVLAGVGAGNVDDGLHYYYVHYVTANGETGYSNSSEVSITVTDNSTDGQVDLSNIPIADAKYEVTARRIYRTVAGSRYLAYLLTTISDNTTTTYRDNTADSGLDTGKLHYRSPNTTAGKLLINGALMLFADGYSTYPGASNTFIGAATGRDVDVDMDSSVLIGAGTGQVSTGSYNTIVGNVAGYYAGANNVIMGYAAGRYHEGIGNVILGYYAATALLGTHATGNYNIVLGYQAGNDFTTAAENILIGLQSGHNITTGGSNILIGSQVQPTAVSTSYQFRLGHESIYILEGDMTAASEWVGTSYEFQTDTIEEYQASGNGVTIDGVLLQDSKMDWSYISNAPTYDNYVSFNLKTDNVQRTTVTSGGDLDIVGGTDITATYSAGGVVTLAYSGSSSSYWDKTGTDLTPATSGDDILLAVTTELIKWGDGDTYVQEVTDDHLGWYIAGDKKLEFGYSAVSPLALHRDIATADFEVGLTFVMKDSSANEQLYGYIKSVITSPTSGSETGRLEFQTVNAGITATKLKINHDGEIIFNLYGVNTFSGTGTYALQVDGSGNIVEVDIFESPLDTKGQLWGFSTVDAAVPAGTTGQTLISDTSGPSTGMYWADLWKTDTEGVVLFTTAKNVGIGVGSSATHKLSVSGSTDLDGNLYVDNIQGHTAAATLILEATHIDIGPTTNNIYFFSASNQLQITASTASIVLNTLAFYSTDNLVLGDAGGSGIRFWHTFYSDGAFQSDVSNTHAFVLNSYTTMVSNYLLHLTNYGVSKFYVDYAGNAYAGGTLLTGGGVSSPLTTKGDIWTYDTDEARLAVGTQYYTLTSLSGQTTGLFWSALWWETQYGLSLVNSSDNVGIGASALTDKKLYITWDNSSNYVARLYNQNTTGPVLGLSTGAAGTHFLISADNDSNTMFSVDANGKGYLADKLFVGASSTNASTMIVSGTHTALYGLAEFVGETDHAYISMVAGVGKASGVYFYETSTLHWYLSVGTSDEFKINNGTNNILQLTKSTGLVSLYADLEIGGNLIVDGTPIANKTVKGVCMTITTIGTIPDVGTPMYSNGTANTLAVCDANNASTMPCIALATTTSTGVQEVLLLGVVRNDDWSWAIGGDIYVNTSSTGDWLTQTPPGGSGDQVQKIGVALELDAIYFNPSLDQIQV